MAQITLNSSGVASNGSLVLQSNGTTAAVTIDTSQRAAFVAGTAALPAITTTGDTNTGIFFPAADTIAFSEGGAEAMRIDSSGNVGIGTSSPDTRLHIDGATNTTVRVTSTTNTDFRGFGIGAAEADTTEYASLKMNIDTGELRLTSGNNTYGGFETFYTNGSERARINSGGDLLVGLNSTQGTKFASDGGAAGAIWGKCSTSATAVNVTWNSATSGNNLFTEFYTDGGPSLRGTIDYNRVGGLVRYNTSSDATLKNIIGDSDGTKSSQILKSTRIREYSWKEDKDNKPQIGVIAQELYETFKGAVSVGGNKVTVDEEGNETTKYVPWAVDKTAFTFHLIAGWQKHEQIIQEQQALIATLTDRITALEQA
jgi:hypothetical protein